MYSHGYTLRWKTAKRSFISSCAEFEAKPGFFQSPEHYDAMMLYITDARRLLDNHGTGFREMTFDGVTWVTVER